MGNINSKHFFQGFFDVLNPGVAKFYHFPCIEKDMIVLFETIGFFKLGEVLAELVFADKVAFNKQVKRIIYRGAAYPVIVILHADIKRLHVKMPFTAVYFLEDGKPLRCLPQLTSLKEGSKYSLYLGIDFLI